MVGKIQIGSGEVPAIVRGTGGEVPAIVRGTGGEVPVIVRGTGGEVPAIAVGTVVVAAADEVLFMTIIKFKCRKC